MRATKERRRPVVDALLDQLIDENGIERDRVLEGISTLLAGKPRLLELVKRDLLANQRAPRKGRPGLSAECVLRFAVLMRLRNWTYREAYSRVSDSLNLRRFVRWGLGCLPKVDAFNRAILRLSPATLDQINSVLVRTAVALDVEDGSRSRVDTTVTETNVHYPTDSSLLRDCARVLTRQVKHIGEREPDLVTGFANRMGRVKRLSRRIDEAARKRGDDRTTVLRQCYRELLAVVRSVSTKASIVAAAAKTSMDLAVQGFAAAIEHYGAITEQVMVQTRRRVFLDDPLAASEKLVSIFETHTQIICRGKVHKPTEYGRKLFLAQGGSGLITDFSVLEGNTADVTLVAPALQHHQRQFKRAPNELAGDRGFFSAENVTRAKDAGVRVVSIPKPGYKSAKQAELEGTREFRRAQRWRAGIEGTISALKRGRGLARCSWRGDRGLRVLVGLAVVTHNLTLLSASFA